jgi:DNA-binding transcriptional regulator YiaG
VERGGFVGAYAVLEYDIMESILKLSMKKTIFSIEHKTLISKLRKARSEAGFQQQDVARILKRTQSFVSKLESGQRRVDAIQLKKLATIYKKPIDFFIK